MVLYWNLKMLLEHDKDGRAFSMSVLLMTRMGNDRTHQGWQDNRTISSYDHQIEIQIYVLCEIVTNCVTVKLLWNL